ncbi:MAG TPA: hypothetical protein VHV74_12280 [Pseudonocardiaceae bacterium]|jgi:hypothetical protein|nr:hypothetical protein [Pseudonocardiaceae bacterium]
MSLASGLVLMAVIFFATWVLFVVVSELIIRRDRHGREEQR